jgi:glucose-1-phosphate thymidylyltransferase
LSSPDEIAFAKGWIDAKVLADRAARFAKNDYGAYLETLLN